MLGKIREELIRTWNRHFNLRDHAKLRTPVRVDSSPKECGDRPLSTHAWSLSEGYESALKHTPRPPAFLQKTTTEAPTMRLGKRARKVSWILRKEHDRPLG